jgi:DNA-binding transcriptional MerR regulator
MSANTAPPVMVTMSQVASILGVNVSTVRRLVLRGAVQPAARAGDNANSAILFTAQQIADVQRLILADADTAPGGNE